MKRVEVCGGIASGKTTLALLAGQARYATALENFRANPFLRAFYKRPSRHALETEITFLLQHFHQLRQLTHARSVVVCDFSFVLDSAYADVTLSKAENALFMDLRDHLISVLGPPVVLVVLRCDSATELKRIRKRGRKDERSITLRYLEAISRKIDQRLSEVPGSVKLVEVDSARIDFASGRLARQRTLAQIGAALRSR